MKTFFTLLISILFVGALSGCDKDAANDKGSETEKIIRVGTSPGPYSDLFLTAIKPILTQQGYTIKTIDFVNLRQADIALNDGDIDLNVDQHTAYYTDFNQYAGGDLVSITPIPTVPAGLYAGRKKSLDQIAVGDKVAIPNDASNTARAYVLLQKAGWIKLKPGTELTKATSQDIAENKYGLSIIEMDSATIPRSLTDLDYAVITGSIVYAANVDPKSRLLQEDLLDHLVLVATVKQKNSSSDWAQAVVNAYRSDEFKQYLNEHNQNDYWFIPAALR